jgi:hypothetical protein
MKRFFSLACLCALFAASGLSLPKHAASEEKGMQPMLAVPERAMMRDAIEVRFRGPGNPGDHLTYVEEDGSRILYAPRRYTDDEREGTVTMRAPEKPGVYRVAYVTGGKMLASSKPIQVSAPSVSLAAPKRVPARQPFEVTVEGPALPGDFLTLGDANGTPISFAAQVPLRGNKRDTLRMTAPQQEGDFTVVYRSGSAVLATAPLEAFEPEGKAQNERP